MYEVEVADDGDIMIRKVPSAYKSPGDTLVFDNSDALSAELSSYGCEDSSIEEALAETTNEYEWITVNR